MLKNYQSNPSAKFYRVFWRNSLKVSNWIPDEICFAGVKPWVISLKFHGNFTWAMFGRNQGGWDAGIIPKETFSNLLRIS